MMRFPALRTHTSPPQARLELAIFRQRAPACRNSVTPNPELRAEVLELVLADAPASPGCTARRLRTHDGHDLERDRLAFRLAGLYVRP